jgi:hypothetical protein
MQAQVPSRDPLGLEFQPGWEAPHGADWSPRFRLLVLIGCIAASWLLILTPAIAWL